MLIILGDAGINFYLDDRNQQFKEELSQYPITLFCVHGNHEEKPYNIDRYVTMTRHEGDEIPVENLCIKQHIII